MPKIKAQNAGPKKAPKKKDALPEGVSYSDTIEDGDQEVVVTQGKIGTGKSTFALSGSKMAPAKWKVHKSPPSRLTTLDDLFFILSDARGLAGAKYLGVKAPTFDLRKAMQKHECDVVDAVNMALDAADASPAEWLVFDTVSSLDSMLLALHMRQARGNSNKYEPYKLNLAAHSEIVDQAMLLGRHIHYLTHSRTFDLDQDNKGQGKSRAVAVAGVGNNEMIPDITGQAGKFYKRHATMQIVLHAWRDRNKLVRQALIGINDEGEGKNRYEGVLPPEQSPPHLRKLLDIIW